MIAELCRNGLHPADQRRPNGPGHVQCGGCLDERQRARWQLAPGGRDGWADPAHDAERQAAYDAWAGGLDDAIARMRAEQGFDGRRRGWRTLGDVVGMQATPKAEPVPTPVRPLPRFVACETCGAGRPADRPCAHCARRLRRTEVSA